MENIITDVQNRIATQLPQILYIGEDWGQLDNYSPNFAVKWPCVLIDVLSIQWQPLGNLVQLGMAQIRLKVADMRLSNSSHKAPIGQKNNSNSFYTLTQAIYQTLNGYTNGNNYSAFIRISERRVQRDDGVKQHEIIFTTQIKDVTASNMPTMQTANVQLIIDN